ncbi:MAG: acylphosphatase [Saprospiraceae bacterium]|nr:acylphosphatase [Saprospiraceae bacterium]
MKNLIIIVEGKVQGVWFRASTRKMAEELNLHGFVKNEPDGSVYIELTGEDQPVMKLIEWALHGPELSVVEKVSIIKSKFVHESGFTIK